MPFGLCNAPATFQLTIKQVLARYCEYSDVYIVDIIIYSRTLAEHARHLKATLADLRQKHQYAKRKKSIFAQEETDFCGSIIGANGV